MINLPELTKQKFERMGWELSKKPVVDNDHCFDKCCRGLYYRLNENLAQLITLDSEIEKLEARMSALMEVCAFSKESRTVLYFNQEIKDLDKKLTELKKMRSNIK